jgi:hypothetical protein
MSMSEANELYREVERRKERAQQLGIPEFIESFHCRLSGLSPWQAEEYPGISSFVVLSVGHVAVLPHW